MTDYDVCMALQRLTGQVTRVADVLARQYASVSRHALQKNELLIVRLESLHQQVEKWGQLELSGPPVPPVLDYSATLQVIKDAIAALGKGNEP